MSLGPVEAGRRVGCLVDYLQQMLDKDLYCQKKLSKLDEQERCGPTPCREALVHSKPLMCRREHIILAGKVLYPGTAGAAE
jgi:hypothetical protein